MFWKVISSPLFVVYKLKIIQNMFFFSQPDLGTRVCARAAEGGGISFLLEVDGLLTKIRILPSVYSSPWPKREYLDLLSHSENLVCRKLFSLRGLVVKTILRF